LLLFGVLPATWSVKQVLNERNRPTWAEWISKKGGGIRIAYRILTIPAITSAAIGVLLLVLRLVLVIHVHRLWQARWDQLGTELFDEYLFSNNGMLLATAVVPLIWVSIFGYQFFRRRVRELRGVSNRCIDCGYDLTGNTSGVCPECGTTCTTTGNRIDKIPALPQGIFENVDEAHR
jgi:hypothetical protein